MPPLRLPAHQRPVRPSSVRVSRSSPSDDSLPLLEHNLPGSLENVRRALVVACQAATAAAVAVAVWRVLPALVLLIGLRPDTSIARDVAWRAGLSAGPLLLVAAIAALAASVLRS